MDERVDRTETKPRPTPAAPITPVERRPRTRRLLLPGLVLAALIGGGVWWFTHQQTAPHGRMAGGPGGMQSAPQPVGFATVEKGDIHVMLNELGTVTPMATVTVVTQISGQLMDVGFKEGQVVKKGDFLAQIDPRPYQAALESAEGTLARDTGLLDQAKADLKRYIRLGRQDSIAQQQLEDQRYLVQQYTGTVQADQGTVDTDKLNLQYCHIVSPVTGRIGLRLVDPGNYIQTTSATAVAVIAQTQPMTVIFAVPENALPQIIQRLQDGATLPVEAYSQDNTKLLDTGKLIALDSEIDTTTGTLRLRARFDNPKEALYPNQFVNARLLVDTMHDVVRVPVPAVLQGEPGTFVYVINANDTVSVRPIKVGPVDGNYEAVLSGLQPGERVVTDGTDRLKDGVKVSLPAARGAANGSASSAQPAAHSPNGGQRGGGPAGVSPGGSPGQHRPAPAPAQ
jgi:multidrug efflux system membrane fusion protein